MNNKEIAERQARSVRERARVGELDAGQSTQGATTMGEAPKLPAAVYVDVFHVEMDGNKATITLGQVRDGAPVYHSAIVLPAATALELAAMLQSLRVKVAEQLKAATPPADAKPSGKPARRAGPKGRH